MTELEKQLVKFKEIMEANGMKILIGGCGCCGSPYVKFEHNGELIVFDESDKETTTSIDEFRCDMFGDMPDWWEKDD